MTDNTETGTSYCSMRADNRERWEFVRRYLDEDHRSALDIGCAEGYFTSALGEFGVEVTGIEGDEDRYRSAESAHGGDENVEFRHHRVTPENVSDLPSADVALLLTVQHHWAGAYGTETASRMLQVVGRKTDLLFYEPPGTMFLSKSNPIRPGESVSQYGEYLQNLFDGVANVRDVELFDHVNGGEYADRLDPLFVVDTAGVGRSE